MMERITQGAQLPNAIGNASARYPEHAARVVSTGLLLSSLWIAPVISPQSTVIVIHHWRKAEMLSVTRLKKTIATAAVKRIA